MKIEKNLEGKNLIIKLEGRLDTNTAPDLEKEVKSIDGVENLIFDFIDLDYISSAGLRTILVIQKIMNNQGTMKIKNVKDEVKEVFEITGFSKIIDIE